MENSGPTYRIFRDQHGIPQFEPKRGTHALKDALIYSFPALETELQLMQAALKKFFDAEKNGMMFVCETPENDLQASIAKKKEIESPTTGQPTLRNWKIVVGRPKPARSRASSRASSRAASSSRCGTPTPSVDTSGGTMMTWMLSNGQELEKKKRQPYDPIKRRKVAENRGNACEKHRAQKTACDPSTCPQNKLYCKVAEHGRRGSNTGLSEVTPASPLIIQPDVSHRQPQGFKLTLTPIIEMVTNNMNSNTIETFILNYASADAINIENEVGTFWEHKDLHNMSIHSKDSIPSLNNSFITNQSSSWTDSPITNSLQSSPYINYELEDLMIENPFPPMAPVEENAEFNFQEEIQFQLFNSKQPMIPSLSVDAPDKELHLLQSLQNSTWLSPSPFEQGRDSTEDPFMGWANKRLSHSFEANNPVLSDTKHP